MNDYPRLLRRSVANRHIAGVCGGLGEYFGFLLSILSAAFPGILVYIVLWILIPEREYY